MVFKKIVLLWQQSWVNIIRTPLTIWLGLLALHMQRFYYALVTTHSFFVLAAFILSMHYVTNVLWGVFLTLLVLSYMIYLMRPAVGLKKIAYLREYFCLENITATVAVLFVYIFLAAITPKAFIALIFIAALGSFSFLYDIDGSIPDKVAYSLVRTGYFLVYKAPVLLCMILIIMVINYFDFGLTGIIFKATFLYPFLAASSILVYVSAVHENYELYYAE